MGPVTSIYNVFSLLLFCGMMVNKHITPPPVDAVGTRYRIVRGSNDGPILQRRVDFSDGSHETKLIGRYFGRIELPESEKAPGDAQKWLSGVNSGNRSLLFLDPEGKTLVDTGSRYEARAPGNSEFHFYQPLTSREKADLARAHISDELWLEQKQEAKP